MSSDHALSFAASFQMIYLSIAHLKADDTYIQLKKDLEYLDLKVGPNKVNGTLSFSSSSPPPLSGLQSCSPVAASNICLPVSLFSFLSSVLFLSFTMELTFLETVFLLHK